MTAEGCVPACPDPYESYSPQFLAAKNYRNKNTHVPSGIPQWECVWEQIATRDQKFKSKGDMQ